MTTATGLRRRFHFSTVVWGAWHTGTFLDVNLTSLLAPRNLAAFAERHDVVYRILTSHADIPLIEACPAYQHASRIVKMELVGVTIDPAIDPIGLHHMLWRRSIDEALADKAYILLIPPDVIWADGCFEHIAEKFLEGKEAVFSTYTRVVTETAVPEVKSLYQNAETTVINATARELVEVCMRHIHPLALTYVRDSPNFPVHPELMLWPVEDQGFLMRTFVREMFAFNPARFNLNSQALLAHKPDETVHYITDSDDLFSLSLTPLLKDVEWFAKPQRLADLDFGAWWLRYDSPANDTVASQYFYIRRKDLSHPAWRRRELESDALVHRLTGTREVLRIISQLGREGLYTAESLVAAALSETRLAQFSRKRGPITILRPSETALHTYIEDGNIDLTSRAGRLGLMYTILDHVIAGDIVLAKGQSQDLFTVMGNKRRLTWIGSEAVIDGAQVNIAPTALGDTWCYELARVLEPAIG